jgi:hypothetical protein
MPCPTDCWVADNRAMSRMANFSPGADDVAETRSLSSESSVPGEGSAKTDKKFATSKTQQYNGTCIVRYG